MSDDHSLGLSLSNESLEKGRGGGGGGGNVSIDDGWDADPLEKAIVVTYFIWFFVTLIQVGFILKRIPNVQTRASKGPFIFMSVVMFSAAIYFAMMGVWYRLDATATSTTLGSIFNTALFFDFIFVAFLPGAILYLLHVRSDIAGQQQQGPTFMSQKRKKIFDWVLIALIYLPLVVIFAWQAVDSRAYWNEGITGMEFYNNDLKRAKLFHASFAFQVIAYLNVVVSSIIMNRRLKNHNTPDAVVTRIMWCTPIFLLLLTIRWFLTSLSEARMIPFGISNVAGVFVDGIASIGIAAIFIWVMTFPGVQWTPHTGSVLDQNMPYEIKPPQNWQTSSYQISAAPPPYNSMPGWNDASTWKPQEKPVPVPQPQPQTQPVVQYSSWNGSTGWQPQAAAQFYALPLQNQSQHYAPPSHPPPGK
ncbi:hypothetical protein CPB86DRAFT_815156 [Serendipita vermifera]|nr:hypothetical protein CPB86DRAFT_815156 [Serendipita vermifera]